MGVRVSHESKRGCGYRKLGACYLVSKSLGAACGKLPLKLVVCPTCGAGIKASRGWTWVDPAPLFADRKCENASCGDWCALRNPERMGRTGLIWIGERFYKTPQKFNEEVERMGVSRRIKSVPRGFKLGETWVLLAHRKISEPCPDCPGELSDPDTVGCETCKGLGLVQVPAIFRVFKPEKIEKIVPEDISDEEVEKLEKQGLSPVIVKRVEEKLFEGEQNGTIC